MSTNLSLLGYLWTLLTLLMGIATCMALFVPVWLEGWINVNGDETATSFGVFRRCNYPQLDDKQSTLTLVELCGRYKSIGDIPSLWWQLSTACTALAAALSLFAAFVSLPSCVCKDIISRTSARVLGVMQLLAAISLTVGCLLYPLGWGSREVREACGNTSAPYKLGTCSIGWVYYMLITCIGVLVLCAFLSAKAGKPIYWRRVDSGEIHVEYNDNMLDRHKAARL